MIERRAWALRLFTSRALSYGETAMCLEFDPACTWQEVSYEAYEASLADLSSKHADVAYNYGLASLAYIRAHADDYNALARLPHAEALLTRYLEIDTTPDQP